MRRARRTPICKSRRAKGRKSTFRRAPVSIKSSSTTAEKKALIKCLQVNKTSKLNKFTFKKEAVFSDEFMQTVKEDVRRQRAEKKDRKASSDLFKKEANIAFRSGDYIKALELYNKVN